MITYQDIKRLCKEKGVTVTGTEKELGFARGSLCKIETSKPSAEKVKKLADYFGIPISSFYDKKEDSTKYYINDETAAIAQDIFKNKELRVLFDAARDAEPEDLETVHNMLLALKRKERGNID